jgi:hypothetical protein
LHNFQRNQYTTPLIVPDDVDEGTHLQDIIQVSEEAWRCSWHECDANRCFPQPASSCRCGGLVVTQPGSTRVVCVECGADYPESPGWE